MILFTSVGHWIGDRKPRASGDDPALYALLTAVLG